jgi:hypothetical protein
VSATEGAFEEVRAELDRATARFWGFHNAHEGYAVILEELDELWDLVKLKSDERTPEQLRAMRKEAKQVAAMAIRFMLEVAP